jgi:hypothetical protein
MLCIQQQYVRRIYVLALPTSGLDPARLSALPASCACKHSFIQQVQRLEESLCFGSASACPFCYRYEQI